jgi:type IV pilus assembly protein PilW
MSYLSQKVPATRRPVQSGFTLIEIMISLVIALFLIGGLVTILTHNRATYAMQQQLAQLQDGERLAMTMITNVVETAGYFPNPLLNSAAASMPASARFATAGTPVIIGTAGVTPQGDSVTVRYAPALNDNTYNCQGGRNTTTAPSDSWENTFSVQVNAAGVSQLVCTFWSASTNANVTVPLVSGVTRLALGYGVQTAGGGTGTCTDTYKTAAQMAAADWANVCSVAVTLTFTNPTNTAGGTQPTVTFTRVIALMLTAGANS